MNQPAQSGEKSHQDEAAHRHLCDRQTGDVPQQGHAPNRAGAGQLTNQPQNQRNQRGAQPLSESLSAANGVFFCA